MTTRSQSLALSTEKTRRRPAHTPWKAILLFIGPAMIYYCIFTVYPFFASIYYSVTTDHTGRRQPDHHIRRAGELHRASP